MMFKSRWIGLIGVFLALAAVWWFILPPALGGRTTLFVTRGISMEPYIHQGDLAVLHKSSRYHVGDVIAYNAKSINAVSLHRIIAVNDDGSFSIKGDNNPEPDLDHPTNADIYGKLDHLLKGKGDLVKVLTSWPIRIIGLSLILWSLYGAFFSRTRDNQRESKKRIRNALTASRLSGLREAFTSTDSDGGGSANPPDVGSSPPDGDDESEKRGFATIAIMALAVIAIVASVILTGAGFLKPARSSNEQKILYTMKGDFNYTGPSAPGGELIYTDGKVQNGDPVYFSLVKSLTVGYDYSFTTLGDFQGSGSYSTSVVLRGSSGWRHTIDSSEAQSFDGKRLHTDAALDLDQLKEVTRQVQALTKVGESGFSVEVDVNITLDGTLSKHPFKDTFPVSLSFSADNNILKSVVQTVGPDAVATPGSGKDNPAILDGLHPNKTSSLTIPAGSPNKVTIAGMNMNVSKLRTIGFAGVLGGFLVLWAASSVTGRRRNKDSEDIAAEVLMHYSEMIKNHVAPPADDRFRVRDEQEMTGSESPSVAPAQVTEENKDQA